MLTCVTYRYLYPFLLVKMHRGAIESVGQSWCLSRGNEQASQMTLKRTRQEVITNVIEETWQNDCKSRKIYSRTQLCLSQRSVDDGNSAKVSGLMWSVMWRYASSDTYGCWLTLLVYIGLLFKANGILGCFSSLCAMYIVSIRKRQTLEQRRCLCPSNMNVTVECFHI